MQDEEIIPFILQRRRVTFFTLDQGFYKRHLCHTRYCLVYLEVEQYEAAAFVRRVLRHKQFDADAKRMAMVVRVSHGGLAIWRLHVQKELHFVWPR